MEEVALRLHRFLQGHRASPFPCPDRSLNRDGDEQAVLVVRDEPLPWRLLFILSVYGYAYAFVRAPVVEMPTPL